MHHYTRVELSNQKVQRVRTVIVGLTVTFSTVLYFEFKKWTSDFNQSQKAVESVLKATSTVTTNYEVEYYSQKLSANYTKSTLLWTESKKTEYSYQESNDPQRPPSKLILLWRPLYKTVKGVGGQMTKHCPDANCRLTSDRKFMPEADAVVFEVEGLYKLPRKTKMGQVWVYVDMESPAWMRNGLKDWNNLFNWTMSYRRDSDLPYFYGSLMKKNQEVDRMYTSELSFNKTGRLLWLVSNCKTPGKRERLVRELQKYTSVDVVGKCGRQICPKGKDCEKSLMTNYKFYFAAENSNCRDYVTEKTYRTYENNILPVVRGGGNYSLYFPPKSFIDTNKFRSKKILGNYKYLTNHLKYFDRNKEIFDSYISTMEQYRADILYTQMWIPFCTLCDRLHNQSKFRRLYRRIHDWWRGQKQTSGYFCNKDELARL